MNNIMNLKTILAGRSWNTIHPAKPEGYNGNCPVCGE
jgi:hypothetical protein